MPGRLMAGSVLAGRYRLDDLLAESRGARFWRAHDTVLDRPVAVHVISPDDERADGLLEAAKLVGPLADRRILRVLDAEITDKACYVINEWGQGVSLDTLVQAQGPLPPRRVAWLVAEVAEALAHAHGLGLAHGRLVPENILIDDHGQVRIIGYGVDAALLGLPKGRRSADVTDLVALVYFGLTGKWPGVSQSLMPPAPVEHGHVLRPRQVRAGVARPLDALCDQVLNPIGGSRTHRFEQDLDSVQGVWEVLAEFLGDASPAVGPHLAPAPQVTSPEVTSPEVVPEVISEVIPEAPDETPDPPAADPPAADPAVTDPPATALPASAVDLPTQAGMPVFHDDSDEVEWLRARSEPKEPPPPFAEAEPKPLFAPDPPEGEPLRRPRPGYRVPTEASADPDYWPWGSSDTGVEGSAHRAGSTTGSWRSTTGGWSSGTGSWGTGSWGTGSWGSDETALDTDEHVPGRSWNRLALLVGACVLVLIAAVAAYQISNDNGSTEDPPPSTSTETPTTDAPTLTPFEAVTVTDFDPQGSPPTENPEQTALTVDGDAATTWATSTYRQNLGPGGLKTGVGLILDLGATKGIREISVATQGGETALAAYVTGAAPSGISDLTPVGAALGADTLSIPLDEAVSGRFVTIWLTSLPAVKGGFRGTVSEVQVLG